MTLQLSWYSWCWKVPPTRIPLLHPDFLQHMPMFPALLSLSGRFQEETEAGSGQLWPQGSHTLACVSPSPTLLAFGNLGMMCFGGIADSFKMSPFPPNFYVLCIGQALPGALGSRLSAFFPNAHRRSLPVPAPQTSPISQTSVLGKHACRRLAQSRWGHRVKAPCRAFCEVPIAG